MDEDIQGDHHHVAGTRAGHLHRYSKGQDVVQTAHGRQWESKVAALMESQHQSRLNDRDVRCPANWLHVGFTWQCLRESAA
ncbi:MAG TPA: hypothetical protein VN638_11645 [Nitrospiraceae bacterium]|nr:hypothetical protein [Nitrospiraceae bacterium]